MDKRPCIWVLAVWLEICCETVAGAGWRPLMGETADGTVPVDRETAARKAHEGQGKTNAISRDAIFNISQSPLLSSQPPFSFPHTFTNELTRHNGCVAIRTAKRHHIRRRATPRLSLWSF